MWTFIKKSFINIVFLGLIALLFNSCSVFFTKSVSVFKITSDIPVTWIMNKDTITFEKEKTALDDWDKNIWNKRTSLKNPEKYSVYESYLNNPYVTLFTTPKSFKKINLTAITDSSTYYLKHTPRPDTNYTSKPALLFIDIVTISGIFYVLANIGQLYEYPNAHFNHKFGTLEIDNRWKRLYKKGNYIFSYGIPYANFYSTFPNRAASQRIVSGFFGISGALDWQYKNKHSLTLECNALTDFFAPFILPFDFDYNGSTRQQTNRINFSLYDNFHLRRFSFGYGLNLSQVRWNYWVYPDKEDPEKEFYAPFGLESFSERYWSGGAVINTFWKFSPCGRLGVVYRPSFCRFNYANSWKYEHSISIEAKWNILLKSKD